MGWHLNWHVGSSVSNFVIALVPSISVIPQAQVKEKTLCLNEPASNQEGFACYGRLGQELGTVSLNLCASCFCIVTSGLNGGSYDVGPNVFCQAFGNN